MATNKTWKEHAALVIQGVIDKHPAANETELRKLVSAAYPYGERKHHPYRQWCNAVNEAFAKGKPATTESVRNMWIK